MNEEIMQEIKSTIPWFLAAALAFAAYHYGKLYLAAREAAASEAAASSYTAEELEDSVSKFGSRAQGGALKIRLAKSYYDAGRYDEASALYAELAAKEVKGYEGVGEVGLAMTTEAQGRYGEAAVAFDAFLAKNPKHYLALTAKLGAARCLAAKGDKAGADARIEALKAEYKGEEMALARVEAAADAIRRYGKVSAPAPVKAEAAPAAEAKIEAAAPEAPAEAAK